MRAKLQFELGSGLAPLRAGHSLSPDSVLATVGQPDTTGACGNFGECLGCTMHRSGCTWRPPSVAEQRQSQQSTIDDSWRQGAKRTGFANCGSNHVTPVLDQTAKACSARPQHFGRQKPRVTRISAVPLQASQSTQTSSESGTAWHRRIYPLSLSRFDSTVLLCIATSPSLRITMQDPQ